MLLVHFFLIEPSFSKYILLTSEKNILYLITMLQSYYSSLSKSSDKLEDVEVYKYDQIVTKLLS
jgi:hypothetical protein